MERLNPMRRITINLLTLCCALAAGVLSDPVFAQQKFPTRTIRIIAPFPAAGAADIVARGGVPERAVVLRKPIALHDLEEHVRPT